MATRTVKRFEDWQDKIQDDALERLDLDRVQPNGKLLCHSQCPSLNGDRCLVTGEHVTTVTAASNVVKATNCTPVYHVIREQYSARDKVDASKKEYTREYQTVEGFVAGDFDKKVAALLADGWKLHGNSEFFMRTLKGALVGEGGELYAVQALTRVVEVKDEQDEE